MQNSGFNMGDSQVYLVMQFDRGCEVYLLNVL